MRSTGIIRSWDFEKGQGIIDSPDIPGGAVASPSAIRCEAVTRETPSGVGEHGLDAGEAVDVVWSPGDTEADEPTVIAVWPSRCTAPVLKTSAYSASLWMSAVRIDGVTIMREVDPNDLPPVPPRHHCSARRASSSNGARRRAGVSSKRPRPPVAHGSTSAMSEVTDTGRWSATSASSSTGAGTPGRLLVPGLGRGGRRR
jgi:hypothetical protein